MGRFSKQKKLERLSQVEHFIFKKLFYFYPKFICNWALLYFIWQRNVSIMVMTMHVKDLALTLALCVHSVNAMLITFRF